MKRPSDPYIKYYDTPKVEKVGNIEFHCVGELLPHPELKAQLAAMTEEEKQRLLDTMFWEPPQEWFVDDEDGGGG